VNKVYEVIIKDYGYDEPVFTKDLKNRLDMSDDSLRQNLKRLADKGALIKVKNGIYYVPRANSVLKKPRVNLDKVVTRKYIRPNAMDVIGYTAGINFANQLGITSQTASVTTIVTNETKRPEYEVTFGKKIVKLRKPKTPITKRNYKILQVLDLLNEYERLSEIPLTSAINIIKKYLVDCNISKQEFNEYIRNYPAKTMVRVLETELYSDFA
jgi:predicted transcriptional regulator of viral defense system